VHEANDRGRRAIRQVDQEKGKSRHRPKPVAGCGQRKLVTPNRGVSADLQGRGLKLASEPALRRYVLEFRERLRDFPACSP
jgi:hypothetical protein